MRSILVIQHVASEGLGLIEQQLESAGFSARYVKVFAHDKIPIIVPHGVSGVIVLGGPMGVYEDDKYPFIKDEIKLLESAIKGAVPVLGVCLGSQLLAKAGGARVYKGKTKEIGWYKIKLTDAGASDRLFMGLPEELTVFQWHGDTFDVPAGGVNLASSDAFDNQAIRVGVNAYGLQFHLEVTPRMITDWISVNASELNALKGKIDPTAILNETPKYINTLNKHANAAIARFLRVVKAGDKHCAVCC